MFLNWNSLCT